MLRLLIVVAALAALVPGAIAVAQVRAPDIPTGLSGMERTAVFPRPSGGRTVVWSSIGAGHPKTFHFRHFDARGTYFGSNIPHQPDESAQFDVIVGPDRRRIGAIRMSSVRADGRVSYRIDHPYLEYRDIAAMRDYRLREESGRLDADRAAASEPRKGDADGGVDKAKGEPDEKSAKS